MLKPNNKFPALLLTVLAAACGDEQAVSPDVHVVATDVQFLVLGKMSLYDQTADGDIELRNHHFVAEIMPRAGREIVSGNIDQHCKPGAGPGIFAGR